MEIIVNIILKTMIIKVYSLAHCRSVVGRDNWTFFYLT